MATESILIRFLVIITLLFFLPKVIHRFYKVPFPIIEVILGILLGIFIPQFFYIDDMLSILSTLGIIILFVYSGLEVDTRFMAGHKKFFFIHALIHLLIVITGQ